MFLRLHDDGLDARIGRYGRLDVFEDIFVLGGARWRRGAGEGARGGVRLRVRPLHHGAPILCVRVVLAPPIYDADDQNAFTFSCRLLLLIF